MANASRTGGGLVKTAVQLSPEQQSELEELARERQVSVSAVVRDAIRGYLADVRRQKEALAAA